MEVGLGLKCLQGHRIGAGLLGIWFSWDRFQLKRDQGERGGEKRGGFVALLSILQVEMARLVCTSSENRKVFQMISFRISLLSGNSAFSLF